MLKFDGDTVKHRESLPWIEWRSILSWYYPVQYAFIIELYFQPTENITQNLGTFIVRLYG